MLGRCIVNLVGSTFAHVALYGLSTQKLLELCQIPHVTRNFVEDSCVVRTFNHLFCDRVVCQVREKVLRAAWVVIVAAEAHVALLVNVDAKWIP